MPSVSERRHSRYIAQVMKMLGGFNIKTKGEKFRFVSLSATLTRVFVFKQENNIKQRHAQFFNPDDVYV